MAAGYHPHIHRNRSYLKNLFLNPFSVCGFILFLCVNINLSTNFILPVLSYPVMGDNYFCKDGNPHEVGIIMY